jgi:hypothetical protein
MCALARAHQSQPLLLVLPSASAAANLEHRLQCLLCYLQKVEVRSSWKQQQPPAASKAVATDQQQRDDAEVQTTDRADAAVQVTASGLSSAAKARVDATSLSSFLQQAGSSMLSELAANNEFAAGRSQHTRRADREVWML